MKHWMPLGAALVLAALVGLASAQTTEPPRRAPRAPYRPTPGLLRSGERLFSKKCADCHGPEGAGDGPAARYLSPPPRDLSLGAFALRSTPSGELPTDWDLYRTLRRGMAGTAMPSWAGLDDRSLWALVHYVKSLSPRFEEEEQGAPIVVPPAPPATPERIARGRWVYARMKCDECHGMDGRGRGPSAWTLEDDQGRRVYPFDFTRGWKMKGGASAEDFYRTLHTGMDGTPMPSYRDALTEEGTWDLVHFVRSLYVE